MLDTLGDLVSVEGSGDGSELNGGILGLVFFLLGIGIFRRFNIILINFELVLALLQ